MSTNPFRRSSLKGSAGTNTDVSPSVPINIPADTGSYGNPLSVNTKAVNSTQKHVNFASPPAVPISPASYPSSSPESNRISPAFLASHPASPGATDYSEAIQSDPFQADAETDENDTAITQALQNAKINTDVSAPDPKKEQEDAVRNTLSRFASNPKRFTQASSQTPISQQQTNAPARHTMDVDAFKRMLLTGNSVQPQVQSSPSVRTSTLSTFSTSENNSGTDTASSSQRSTFDQSQGTADDSSSTASSSDDSDQNNVETFGPQPSSADVGSEKRKPPPPKSRHGKAIQHNPISTPPSADASVLLALSDPQTHDSGSGSSDLQKQAPSPPMSRRRSQNSGITQTNSTRQSPSGGSDTVGVHLDKDSRAPRPPPSRRPGPAIERRTSTDLAPTLEESDSMNTVTGTSRKPSDTRPPPPPARNSSGSKRMSLATMVAPPPPPPRRGRGSSRSSIDGQNLSIPPLSSIGNTGSTRSSGEYTRPEMEGQKVLSSLPTNDILADLAALQREVDEARRLSGV